MLPPTFFSISMQLVGVTLSQSTAVRPNIIDLVDSVAGTSLFALSTTESTAMQLKYDNVVVGPYSAQLGASYATTYITVSFSVQPNNLLLFYPTGSITYPYVPRTDTTSRYYNLFISNPRNVSAGGSIRNIVIGGKVL